MPKRDNVIRTDVLIVGGGLAGLTTAIGLRESGLKVTLVEKEKVLGGRAQSWTDKTTGDAVHNGPHIVLSKYPNMFKLLEILGTRDRIEWQRKGLFITMVKGREEIDMTSDPRLPAPLHFSAGVLRDKNLSMRDILSAIPMTLYAQQLSEDDVLKLDNVNASAFLRGFGVTEHMIDYYFSFVGMAILNVPLDLCSAGAFVRFYVGLLGVPELQIGFPSCGLSDLYVPQAEKLLKEAGVTVLKNTGVARFTGDVRHVTGAELDDGRRIRAKHVVAALTPTALRRALLPEWIKSYKVFHELVHFQECPYYSTYLWFDKKLTDKAFWARAYNANDLNCDFYDLGNIYPELARGGSLITTNCIYCHRAAGMSDAEIIAETRRELAEYLPEAARAKLTHAVVNRIPMAIHCPYPGMEQRRAKTVSPVRNLYLAGDWMGTGIPSCMENACLSGWLVAEELLKTVGQEAQLSVIMGTQEISGISRVVSKLGNLVVFDPIAELFASKKNAKATFLQ
jgi:15-cis-phytoene desaturase